MTLGIERKRRCSWLQQTTVLLVVACAFLLSGKSCVDLSKPPNVESCARAGTCADDSTRHTDAATDGKLNADQTTVADLASGGNADGTDALSDVLSFDDVPDASVGGNTSDAADGALDDGGRDVPAEQQSPEVAMPDLGGELGPEPPPPPEPGRDGGAGNCITQIIANGYAYGSVTACSACRDNNLVLLTSKCMAMLDCLAPPSTRADMTNCLNAVGGSTPVFNCVNALTIAGCPSGF